MLDTLNVGDRVRLIFDDTPNLSQEAVVCSVLSNQQEGLGPEIADYIACWLEVSLTLCSESATALSISLGTDYRYDLGGRKLQIVKISS